MHRAPATAEAPHALGRDAEALGWHGSLGQRSTTELPYLVPAQWRRGRILESRGDRTGALEAYRLVIRSWSDADAPFRPILLDAQLRTRTLGGAVGSNP